MKALEYALMYLVPISVIIGLVAGNLFIFLTPLLVFGLIPPAGPDCCQGHREPARRPGAGPFRIWSIEAVRQQRKRRPVWNFRNPMNTVLLVRWP
jgi:hypothetical protein